MTFALKVSPLTVVINSVFPSSFKLFLNQEDLVSFSVSLFSIDHFSAIGAVKYGINLFSALNKDRAVPYDGPRNVRDIHTFLQEKVSYMFTLKKNDGDDNERAKDVGGGGHDEL